MSGVIKSPLLAIGALLVGCGESCLEAGFDVEIPKPEFHAELQQALEENGILYRTTEHTLCYRQAEAAVFIDILVDVGVENSVPPNPL